MLQSFRRTVALVLLLAACTPATTNDHAAAEIYIRAHISELSPTPAVLGGTFYVTDITWENDDTARVAYEDGHIALTGRTTITVRGDTITATTLSLIDTESSASSSGSVASVTERPRSQEGESCGGFINFECDVGLMCKYDGAYPDAGGTCVK